jgi:hypothetical protein
MITRRHALATVSLLPLAVVLSTLGMSLADDLSVAACLLLLGADLLVIVVTGMLFGLLSADAARDQETLDNLEPLR